jgi:hypothetical protein
MPLLTRRAALASLVVLALPAAARAQTAAPAGDPTALLSKLYQEAGRGGGNFADQKGRAKYLTKSFAAL